MITPYHAGGSTGIGVQDAALRAAGFPSTYGSYCTDHWDGTNWSAGGAVIQRRFQTGNAGTVNAALLFGGRTYTPSLTNQTCTEEYNGTSWSETGASGPAYSLFQGGGLQNAAFAFLSTDHDQYDGTTWSEAASLSIGKSQGAAAGTVNSTLTVGGLGSPHALSLHYDGTTWSSGGSLSQTQYTNAGNGTQGAALATGGGSTPGTHHQCTAVYDAQQTITGSFGRIEAGYVLGNAEDIKGQIPRSAGLVTSSAQLAADISGSFISGFTFGATADEYYVGVSGSNSSHSASISGSQRGMSVSGSVSNTLAALAGDLGDIQGSAGAGGAWSEGDALVACTGGANGGGTGNAGIIVGGRTPNRLCTQLYDGTSWSLGTAVPRNSGNANYGAGWGFGLQDSFIDFNSPSTDVQEYNGTTWSEVGNMSATSLNSDKSRGAGFNARTGIAMAVGSSPYRSTEHYNGTSWSSGGELISAGGNAHSGAGSEHSAMFILNSCVQEYDGSVWSLLNTQSFPFSGDAFGSKVDNVVAFGGSYGVSTSCAFDGTSWAATGNTIRGMMSSGGGTGGHNAGGGGFRTGGRGDSPYQYGGSTCTEHYNVTYKSTGSFGRIEAGFLHGDAGNIGAALASGSNLVSGSSQLAEDISGSFTSGFNFGHTFDSKFGGVSGSRFTPGVSGSEQFYSSSFGHPSEFGGVSGSHPSGGADYSHLIDYETGHIRGQVASYGVFSAGGAMITARGCLGGAGVQNAALAFGGGPDASPGGQYCCTEHYNGSAWSAGGVFMGTSAQGNQNDNTSYISGGGIGIQNAAVAAAQGWNDNYVWHYDGVNWRVGANRINSHVRSSQTGTENAALVWGGRETYTCTEEYNGTSWVAGGALISGRQLTGAAGLQNAALAVGGQGSPGFVQTTDTEEYDGSTWAAGGALSIAVRYGNGGGGVQNSAVNFGDDSAISQHYNGTSWSAGSSKITSRTVFASTGLGYKALVFGGVVSPANSAVTEHYDAEFMNTGSFGRIEAASYFNGDATSFSASLFDGTNTLSSSAQIADDVSGSFISGLGFGAQKEDYFTGVSGSTTTPGVSGSSAFYSSSYGHPTLIYASGSASGSDYSHLQAFDIGHIRGIIGGGSWSSGASMINARAAFRGSGMYNSSLVAMDQFAPHASSNTATEEYEGIAWAVGGAASRDFSRANQVGYVNAAVKWGGYAQKCETEEYNGTVWSNASNMSNGQHAGGAAGTQNAALAFQGRTGGVNSGICTEEYNGTSWSTSGAVGAGARYTSQGFGTQNSAVAFGNQADTHLYDGSTWSTLSGVAAAHPNYANGQSAGTQTGGLAFGGGNAYAGSANTTTYQFDGSIWSSVGTMITFAGHKFAGGTGDSHRSLAFGGNADSPYNTGGGGDGCTRMDEWDGNFMNTGSFGRVEATNIFGDASEISSALLAASPVKTSSEGFQSEISGSIKGGIDLEGPITSQPVGAWSQVASSRVDRSQHVIVGNKNSAILLGGGQYSPTEEKDATEIYDGVAWRDFVRLPHPFVRGEASGQVGSELIYGGNYSGSNGLNVTLSGNGTSFNQEAYMVGYGQNQAAQKGGNIGIQNAALATANLHSSPGVHRTQVYDGNSWGILPSNTNSCAGHASTGVVNAAILTGGHARCTCSEIWDGTSWSVGNPLIRGKCAHAMGGSVNDGMAMGGNSSNSVNMNKSSELWDGVAWSSTAASALGLHTRADSNLNSSDGAIMHGQHTSDRQTFVWDTYYATSGSFGRAEPKYGIVTERFELKNKNIDDNNTVLLIHSNTENDSVVFSGSMGDSSLSNHSMSFSGSVKHTSSFAQFGRTSLYFGGSGSLEVSGSGTENRDLEFGNNEFTIEYWVRQDDAQTAKTVFRKPGSYVLENETDVNNIIFKFNESASISVSSNYTSSVDLWNHVAVVRHEGTLNMYINGKLRDTRANMTESMGSYGNSLFIGDADSREGTDTAFTGYIDEFRISNIARYNTEFVPEEGEIQRIGSGSSPDAPFNHKKDEAVTFKLPQFTNFDQPAILTQTLFQTNFSSSLSSVSGSRTGRSGSAAGKYGYEEENVGTVAGDMWFNRENNSLNFTFESSSYSAGAWSAGGDILTPYSNRGGGTGLPDAAVSFNAGGGAATSSINYDGAAWSLSGTMILARTQVGSAGTSQNAAMAIGGYSTPFTPGMCTETETYDGMSWTEVANVITGRRNADGAGAQNAALFIGGYDVAASANSNKTEHYDGSSWSAGGALIIARQVHTAAGEEYNALAIAGKVPSVSSTMEEYNGSVWSSGTSKITALAEGAGDGGIGGALMAGSGVSPNAQTEEYNGISWKAGPNLITGRQDLESASVGFATSGKGVVFGGRTPGATRATEEYDYSGVKTTLVICALTGSQA